MTESVSIAGGNKDAAINPLGQCCAIFACPRAKASRKSVAADHDEVHPGLCRVLLNAVDGVAMRHMALSINTLC
jgi:hypothetical protein